MLIKAKESVLFYVSKLFSINDKKKIHILAWALAIAFMIIILGGTHFYITHQRIQLAQPQAESIISIYNHGEEIYHCTGFYTVRYEDGKYLILDPHSNEIMAIAYGDCVLVKEKK